MALKAHNILVIYTINNINIVKIQNLIFKINNEMIYSTRRGIMVGKKY
jgi:hypothetical protein